MSMHLRRTLPALIAAAALLVPLSACTAAAPMDARSLTTVEPGSDARPAPATGGTDAGATEGATVDGAAPGASVDRSVIRTGDLSLTVDDPARAADRVSELVVGLDGTVESENVTRAGAGNAESATLTVRVPEARLDETFDALSEVGTVTSQSRSAVDVTAQRVDLQARVEALQASVDRLSALMRGAASTSELIEAESALSQRQQELDGLRAQLQSLEGEVEEATIFVTLSAPSALPGGGPATFWEGLVAGFGSLGTAAAGALVLLGVLLPWLVVAAIVAGAVWVIVRGAQRRRARRDPATPGAVVQPEIESGPHQGVER